MVNAIMQDMLLKNSSSVRLCHYLSGLFVCSTLFLTADILRLSPTCGNPAEPNVNVQRSSLHQVFLCVFPVPKWSSEECEKSHHAQVPGDNGYLSFKLGHNIQAGTESCPWKVDVGFGQKVQFDVFSYLPMKQDGSTVIEISNGAPCKHSLVFIDGQQKHEVGVFLQRPKRWVHLHSEAKLVLWENVLVMSYRGVSCSYRWTSATRTAASRRSTRQPPAPCSSTSRANQGSCTTRVVPTFCCST